MPLTLGEVAGIVGGQVVSGHHRLGDSVSYAFASDLMSDVLTTPDGNFLLITGLANTQSIRTAEMSDVQYMVLARGKEFTPAMAAIADELGMVVIRTPMSVFRVSGLLYANGIKPVY